MPTGERQRPSSAPRPTGDQDAVCTQQPPQHVRLATALKKLFVRATCDVDSVRCGELNAGETVHILEMRTISPGLQRARVARGVSSKDVLGWVTAAKDGTDNFADLTMATVVAAGETQAAGRDSSSSSPKAVHKGSLKRTYTPTGSPKLVRAPTAKAMLLHKTGPAKGDMKDDPVPPPRQIVEGMREKIPVTTTSPISSGLSRQSSMGSSKGLGRKADSPKEAGTLLTAAELLQQADGVLQRAAAVEARAETVRATTFERRLGFALLAKLDGGAQLADLVRSWDFNKDGDISGAEFRACVRNSLKLTAENAEIDGFFNRVDADGGGSLDLAELKPALKMLKDAATKAEAEASAMREQGALLRQKAEAVREVARATKAVEEASARVREAQADEATVEQQLSTQIASRSLKVADVVSKWDREGRGGMSCAQFAQHVREMGVKAASAAGVEALFDQYSEGGSTLKVEKQLKPALKRLVALGAERQARLKDLERVHSKLFKAAARQQHALAAAHTQEAEEAKAAEVQEAKVAAEAQAAEAAVKRLAKERHAAAMKAKAMEKEAFDAKIAARRAAVSASSGAGRRGAGAPMPRAAERAPHLAKSIAV